MLEKCSKLSAENVRHRERERESNVDLLDRSFSEDWVMSALSEIVDGPFYNLKNALTLYTKKKKKKTGVVLLVFHVRLCDQAYLL